MEHTEEIIDRIVGALLGHAVGDALGVPVEFQSRDELACNPVTDLQGFGTHNQPPGTWSDDTSLTLCTAEALCDGFDLARMGNEFVRWLFQAHWTPRGRVFDVGVTTRDAIVSLKNGAEPTQAGPRDVYSNGNGALMRILPVGLFEGKEKPTMRQRRAMQASCLTHGHPRSQLACAFYCELIAQLLQGDAFPAALSATQRMFRDIIDDSHLNEAINFYPILDPDLLLQDADEISGSGYVLHCLRASLWCVGRSGTFEESVLMAVNLGQDTDTTAAVTGGLAALRYGRASIPERWICSLSRLDEVVALYERFAHACVERWGNQNSSS